jgi:hypothetical protein
VELNSNLFLKSAFPSRNPVYWSQGLYKTPSPKVSADNEKTVSKHATRFAGTRAAMAAIEGNSKPDLGKCNELVAICLNKSVYVPILIVTGANLK